MHDFSAKKKNENKNENVILLGMFINKSPQFWLDKADSNLYLMHPDVTTFRSRPPEKEFAHDSKTGNVDCDDSRDIDCHAENEMKKNMFLEKYH